jgi:SPP1 family predicted phage head-tail adaptor
MSRAPTIGDLRLRVTIEKPIDAPDGAGGFTRGHALLARVWARIEATNGQDRFVEQRQEQSITHVAHIRWRPDVTSQMRLAFRSRTLLIQSVYDADERRRFLTCHCEEISS